MYACAGVNVWNSHCHSGNDNCFLKHAQFTQKDRAVWKIVSPKPRVTLNTVSSHRESRGTDEQSLHRRLASTLMLLQQMLDSTVLIAVINSRYICLFCLSTKSNLCMLNLRTQWDSTVFIITDGKYSLNIHSGNDAEWSGIENSVKSLSECYTRISRQIVSLGSSYLFKNKM